MPRLFLHEAGTATVREVRPSGANPGESVFALAWDRRGFFWLGAGVNLYRLELKGKAWVAHLEVIPGWPRGSGGVSLLSLVAEGGVWVATCQALETVSIRI